MSFSLFKSNMKFYMENQNGIEKYQDWTDKIVSEYDSCVKRGGDMMNGKIPVQIGKTSAMKSMVNIACMNGLNGSEQFYNDFGKGVVAYWTGAEMSPFPIPLTPAPSSVQNIQTTKGIVSNPGTWAPGKLFPTDKVTTFLDRIVSGMQGHINTVGGEYYTQSLYPAGPSMIVLPGMVKWMGYTIP